MSFSFTESEKQRFLAIFEKFKHPYWRFDKLDNCMEYYALHGNVEGILWASELGDHFDSYTLAYAAHGGHLEIMKWLRGNGCPWGKITMQAAIHKGYLEIIKWCREEGCP